MNPNLIVDENLDEVDVIGSGNGASAGNSDEEAMEIGQFDDA